MNVPRAVSKQPQLLYNVYREPHLLIIGNTLGKVIVQNRSARNEETEEKKLFNEICALIG